MKVGISSGRCLLALGAGQRDPEDSGKMLQGFLLKIGVHSTGNGILIQRQERTDRVWAWLKVLVPHCSTYHTQDDLSFNDCLYWGKNRLCVWDFCYGLFGLYYFNYPTPRGSIETKKPEVKLSGHLGGN